MGRWKYSPAGRKSKRGMKPDKSLEPFRAAIESLQRLLREFDDRGVIVGGIAVGFLGKPRFTADIDAVFLLSVADIPKFLNLAQGEFLHPNLRDVCSHTQICDNCHLNQARDAW